MRITGNLKLLCTGCRVTTRGSKKKVFVVCDINPRHKQRQGSSKKVYGTWKGGNPHTKSKLKHSL